MAGSGNVIISASHVVSPVDDAEKRAMIEVASTVVRELRPPVARSAIADQLDRNKSMSGDGGVRILGLDEYKEAAYALAEAFSEDHTCLYFTYTPDTEHWTEEQRWNLHLSMMEYITYAHLLKGLVVCAGPNYDCVGLWMPPGENIDDYFTVLRSGMWRLSYQLSREGRKRFFDEFLPLLTDTKAQVMGARDDDSWYLVYIGTRPSGRGKGYARKVIEHVTAIADRDSKACYLESSNYVNQFIYGKMGFSVRKNIYLQREFEHVQLDIMVREPRPGSDSDSGVDVK